MMIIDGTNKILGRLASFVAKALLNGEEVIVVNAEKIVVKKDPTKAFNIYMQKVQRGNPYSGPFYPKRADLIFRRTVRGMLPYKTTRGEKAFKRLKVYLGVPEQFQNAHFVDVKSAEYDNNYKAITLFELSKKLGAKYKE